MQLPEPLLDLMYVLINDLHLELQLLLPLDLLLVLAGAQLPILVLHALLLNLHGREGILQVRQLLGGLRMCGVGV